ELRRVRRRRVREIRVDCDRCITCADDVARLAEPPQRGLGGSDQMFADGFHLRFTQKRSTAFSSTSMPNPGPCGTGMKPSASICTGLQIISRSMGFSQTLYSRKSERGSTALKCRLAAVSRPVSQ